jgi:MoaA/NifB/PqqE/SkfB family radical SAM enzyme
MPMSGDAARAPRLVAWEATRACDLACVHCRAVAQPVADPRQLRTDEAFRLVDDIAAFQQPVILILTGGDPLKREDIFEVAARATRAGLRVVMSPSGTQVTPTTVSRLKAAGVQRISVSLDGSTPELHDDFRQVPGAFAAATESLAYAREGGLPFQINTTVTQHNRHDLASMLRRAVELGAVTWDVFMLVPTGRGRVQMEITPEAYEETLHFVYEASQTAPIQVKMTCAPHYKRLQLQERKRQGARPGPARRGTPRTGSPGDAWRGTASASCPTSARWAAAGTCRSWRGTCARPHWSRCTANPRCSRRSGIRTCCRGAAGCASTGCSAGAAGRAPWARPGITSRKSPSAPTSPNRGSPGSRSRSGRC